MKVTGQVRVASATAWLPPGRSRAVDALAGGVLSDIDARATLCHEVPVAGGIPAWELGLRACRQALSEADVPPGEVDFLSYAGMSVLEEEPASPAHRLARMLGASRSIVLGVSQMSSGGDAALHAAVCALLTEPDTRHAVACTGMDTDGLPYDRWLTAPEVVLGDGGTAALLGRDRGSLVIHSIGRAACAGLEPVFPGRHPFRPLSSESGREPEPAGTLGSLKAIRATVTRAVERALADADVIDPSRVKVVYPPRTRPQTVRHTVRAALPAVLRDRLMARGQRTGHLGAGDTLANLADLLATDRVAAGEYALLVGVGAGFTASALVVQRV